jgi:EAL domain-containing protein (putative c-di-GMP-specific phosphodiesterase class I)
MAATHRPAAEHPRGHELRFFQSRPETNERLLWSRDIRFCNRVAETLPEARILELEQGSAIIAPAEDLGEATIAEIARGSRNPDYGLVAVDRSLPISDRYVVALSAAVQQSGLADRIGMAQSTQAVQTKTLDYFFNLRNKHLVQFQPIVALANGQLHEYECLFRPDMPMLPQSISSIVQAAIDTERSVELDTFIVRTILDRAGSIQALRTLEGSTPFRFAINLTPASLLDPKFEAKKFEETVRKVGLMPHQITLECTEQQAVSDVVPLKKQVKALRRLGFGFAVDDAGAGYASFTLIAALRPSGIKIDKEIVHGLAKDDAKQALVEAFVSFGRRIGAVLLAEGIEKRADLKALRTMGVALGQGYLLGKPNLVPQVPRRLDVLNNAVGRVKRKAGATRAARAERDAAREAVAEVARERGLRVPEVAASGQ